MIEPETESMMESMMESMIEAYHGRRIFVEIANVGNSLEIVWRLEFVKTDRKPESTC